MTIKQFCDGEHGEMIFATPAQRHAARALEQAAAFAVQRAMTRWSGGDEARSGLDVRAGWLAEAQRGLQQWFEEGGFGQDEGVVGVVRPVEETLAFPGSRPMFYSLFRRVRSVAD